MQQCSAYSLPGQFIGGGWTFILISWAVNIFVGFVFFLDVYDDLGH